MTLFYRVSYPPDTKAPAKVSAKAGAKRTKSKRRGACATNTTVENSSATQFRRYVVDRFLRVEVIV